MRSTKVNLTAKAAITAITAVLLFVLLICGIFCVKGTAYATDNAAEDITALCKSYTEEETLHNDSTKHITNYESYINERFQIGSTEAPAGITDEWIFRIVPEAVFKLKQKDFFYIGEKYGFYVNYDSEKDKYLVFLMLHSFDYETTSGHIVRRITPLYYEQYEYDETAGTASLEYAVREVIEGQAGTTKTETFYQKYSDIHNVYLKDISFGGSLYNENHYNIGEEEYIAEDDRGAYFIGTSYKFNGMSTKSEKGEYIADLFQSIVACIPLTGKAEKIADAIGKAVNIAELIESSAELAQAQKQDFRGTVTNENDYTFRMVDIESHAQISKFGNLLKDIATVMETPDTKDGLLYGINRRNYAQATFYCNYADDNDRWNSGFSGTVRLSIVEEKGILGDTADIATDIVANDYYKTVYGEESTDVNLDEIHEIYGVAKVRNRLRFTAPVNGVYTFETAGGDANRFVCEKGEITAAGVNSKLEVYLKEGETLQFYSENLEDRRSIYDITAKFAPAVLGAGESCELTIAPNETEYFALDASDGKVYDWSVSGGGKLGAAISFGLLGDPNAVYGEGTGIHGSLIAAATGRYYFGITNCGAESVTVTAAVTEPETLGFGSTDIPPSAFDTVLRAEIEYTSAYTFGYSGASAATARIYDENMNEISRQSGTQFTLSASMTEGNTYYIALGAFDSDAECRFYPSAQKLAFGDNSLTKTGGSALYVLPDTQTAVRVNVSADGVQSAVFDADMQSVAASFVMSAGDTYYVGVKGDAAAFTVGIEPTVSPTQGSIGEDGFALIAFTAPKTGNYTVSGADNAEWFNTSLQTVNPYLTAGATYYLKLSGAAGTSYDVSIEYDAPALTEYIYQNVSAGYYKFTAAETDTYLFRTLCANGKTASVSLYDAGHNLMETGVNATAEDWAVVLDAGVYYVDIAIDGGTSTTVRIIPANGTADYEYALQESKSESVAESDAARGYVFGFTARKTATYYFKVTAAIEADFSLSVCEGENGVDYEDISASYQGDDKSNLLHLFAVELEAGHSYKFYYYDGGSVSMRVSLYVPAAIEKIMIGDITAYADGSVNNDVRLVMDTEYNVNVVYNADATEGAFEIKIDEYENAGGIAAIDGANLTVGFDTDAEKSKLALSFRDDFSSNKSVTAVIYYPYYASATLNDDYVLTINTTNSERDAVSENNGFVSAIIYCGDNVYETSEKSVNMISWHIFNSTVVELSVSYRTSLNNMYSVECVGGEYVVNTILYNSYIHSAVNDTVRFVIDARNANTVTSKTLILPATAKAVFIISQPNKIFENLSFEYKGEDDGYLYLENLRIRNIDNADYAIKSTRSNLIWENAGDNLICGKAKLSLIYADGNIKFIGEGSLIAEGDDGLLSGESGSSVLTCNILSIELQPTAVLKFIGGNGIDGSDGTIGANGTDFKDNANGKDGTNGTVGGSGGYAVKINQIKYFVGENITFTGGNGGNGGKGGHGGDGIDGNHPYKLNSVGGSPGNGGNGGHGGNGGEPGKGCNITINYSSIVSTNGYGGWGGNGGNGGNGGKSYEPYWVGGAHATLLKGSPGANGGNGGNAGINGDNIKSDDKILNAKLYGKGGDGGNGSAGAHGKLQNNVSVTAQVGGNGGKGGNGYFGGNGGCGGNGGNGSNGRDGSLFIKCEAGDNGANGGNGGKGGNATGSPAFVGHGGMQGYGGIGGNPGNPVLDKNAKGPGAKGADGIKGNDGSYIGESSGSCVAAGTLITLADGSQVPVESLTGDELLLVWNMFTGEFDVAPILFIDSDPAREYKVINLYFSDGTVVKVIDEHGFWDYDLNEYVFMRSDAAKYIGHWFGKQTIDGSGNFVNTRVQLVDVKITDEYTSAWSPVTYGHLCFYVNGMLSMPGATTGLINIFEVDPETMTVDREAFEADIAKYGLFTYEEFAAVYDVPEIIFDAFNGQYLKVAMGKGLLTEDMLTQLIERYSKFF